MADMPPISLPYIRVYYRRGKPFAYYRRGGRQVRVGWPVTAETYEAARKAWEGPTGAAPEPKARAGTIAALVEAYKAAPEYRRLAKKTQADYRRTLDMIVTRFGLAAYKDIGKAWVYRLRNELQEKPRSANYRVAIVSAVLQFAVKNEMLPANPAHQVEKLVTSGEGYRPWTDDELAAMTGTEAGDVALPVLIGRYTGQREGDILRLPWGAYDGSTITLRQSKTGVRLAIPVCAELRAVLDTETRRGLLVCLTEHGKVWKADWFRHRFAQVREAAGLPADLHFHGLRATRLTELAEAGATEREIQATSGHKTTQMVQRYTRAASQKGLAAAAVARLPKRNGG